MRRGARRLGLAGLLAASGVSALAAPPRPPVDEAIKALTAAAGPLRVRRSAATGVVSFLAASEGRVIPVADAAAATPEARALAFVRRNAGAFGLAAESDLAVRRVDGPDGVGMDHVRLQQIHQGVPVTGAEVTVHLRGEGVASVLAKTVPDLGAIDVQPGLGAEVAERAALEAIAKETGRTKAMAHEVRLEIFNRGLLEGGLGVTRLAWFVEVRGEGLREYVWVDARRGVVLLRFSQVPEARDRRVHTANNGPSLPGVLIRSEGGAATGNADADAAYDYSGDAYDYFATQHGRDSFDGAGAPIVSTVSFCPSGGPCPYPNAAWTGSQLVYGQGFSRADDVDAHEYTHAITERTANLFYYMQSGALNESISDIFGETVDLSNGKGNDAPSVRWLVGEDVSGAGAIRNMMDPTQFGDPGNYGDRSRLVCSTADNGGVHTNSGVPNHAYALLVDGGSYFGYTVTGIGATKAAAIVYRTLSSYLTSASNFVDFADAMRQSCSELVGGAKGIAEADCEQVDAALKAVEMEGWGCGLSAPTPPLCDLETPVMRFQDDLENPSSGAWTTGFAVGGNHWTGGAGVPDVYWTGFSTSGHWSFWGYGAPARGDSWVAMGRSVPVTSRSLLRFRHFLGFEGGFDGGVVEYSLDEGKTWGRWETFVLGPGFAYPGGPLATNRGNPLAGRIAFSGQSWGYVSSQAVLRDLAGSNARFRFRIGTDRQIGDIGWFIDDVRVYDCAPWANLSIDNVTVPEGDAGTTSATFTLHVSENPYSLPVDVDFTTQPASATSGVDFVPMSGRLHFPPGIAERSISVPIVGDRVAENDEAFRLVLSNPVNARFATFSEARAEIVNDDAIGVVISDVALAEPRTGTAEATFTVAQPEGSGGVSVTYQTMDGTATAPADYEASSGMLTFAPGDISRTITIPVKASATNLSPRTFHVDLSNSLGTPIVRSRGTATIYEAGFYAVPPCRILDTRVNKNGPALSAGATREVVIGEACGIPAAATAVSLNVTVVSPTGPGDLRLFPATAGLPLVSAINYAPGQTRANNAVVSLSPEGRLKVFCEQLTGEADLILDVNGFFE